MSAARDGRVLCARTSMTSVWPTGLAETRGTDPSLSCTAARTGWLLSTWISVATARVGSFCRPVFGSNRVSVDRAWSRSCALPWYTGV